MSIFNRLFKSKTEQRSFLPQSYATVYTPLTFNGESDPCVSSCIEKIVNTVSTLPMRLYSHTKGGKVQVPSHWLFKLLENPAVEETAVMFYQSLLKQLLYTGNAYIFLCRNSKGEVITSKIVDSKRVRVSRDDSYHKVFTVDGKDYYENQILHIPYYKNYNGTIGQSPIEANRDIIYLHQLLLQYISAYFNNSVGSRMYMSFGESWGNKPSDLERLYSSILPYMQKFVLGPQNAGKVMLPPPDVELKTLEQKSNVQAELTSLLQMVEKQICLAFSVPPEILDSSQSKYNSLEQKNLDFLQNCICVLCQHIAESYEKLLSPTDDNLFIQYEYSNMLRTDFRTTVEYLSKEVQSGLLSLNEARAKISLSAIDPAVGDIYWMPSNLIPATKENVEAILAKSKLALEESNSKEEDHNILGDDKN